VLFREFTIRTEREGDTHTAAPSGELDIATAPLLEVEIRRAESADDLTIVLDLGKVAFQRRCGSALRKRAPQISAASACSSNSARGTGTQSLWHNQPTGFRGLMLELIECDVCGRHFATLDAPGMLAAITGVRPTCAGSFRLAPDNVAWPPTPVHADRVAR